MGEKNLKRQLNEREALIVSRRTSLRRKIAKAAKAPKTGKKKQRDRTRQNVPEDTNMNETYTGPWAPSHEINRRENYTKQQRIEESQDEEELNSWCEVKLSALRRILEFTQEEKFIDVDKHAIETKLEMLDDIWKEYDNACHQLFTIGHRPNYEYLEQGESIYFNAKTTLRARLAMLIPNSQNKSDNVLQIQWSDMPGINKLPTFSGDFAKWASFRDVFLEEVHNNSKLTNAQRLRTLLSSLDGSAKRAIGEWSVANDANYQLAWHSLRQQYDNNHQTIRAHMKEVSGLQPVRAQSFDDLRDVLDTVRVNRRHSLSLLSPQQLVDYQFLHQIEQLLDLEGRRDWEMRRRVNELPTLEDMFTFLEQRANCIASLAISTNKPAVTAPVPLRNFIPKTSSNTSHHNTGSSQLLPVNGQRRQTVAQNFDQKRQVNNRKCFKCGFPSHSLYNCDQFKAMPMTDRKEFVNKQRLCESCFSPNHLSNNCSREMCPNCPGQRHNSSICPENRQIFPKGLTRATVQLKKQSKQTSITNFLGASNASKQYSPSFVRDQDKESSMKLALLATAQVQLKVGPFTTDPIRALCDSGSQVNLISKRVVQTEVLLTKQCHMRILGVNSSSIQPVTKKVCCQLLSRFNDKPIAEIELLVIPELSMNLLPNTRVPIDFIPKNIELELADPDFNIPGSVDIILGAGIWSIIMQDVMSTNEFGIIIQSSRLGWLVYGGGVWPIQDAHVSSTFAPTKDEEIALLINRFWEVEHIPEVKVRTNEQEQCENFFMNHHYRSSGGRYVVGIPFRSDIDEIGSSREIALRRLFSLERRFEREPLLHEKYVASMNEMMIAGHLLEVYREPKGWCYYIPHHAVTKKFRVVFDASCKTDHGISLNEAQMIGEKLQDDLFNLIMRFRTHRIGITTDVKKMYLQVEVIKEQWDVQRIFWRSSPKDELKEYWLTRVTFGMASAPHCAVRAMIQCARDQKDLFPRGARTIEKDFYMDDGITGADNEEEAHLLCIEMSKILGNGGFPLTKWHSNGVNVVPTNSTQVAQVVELGEFNDTTVLGLRWLPSTDELTFKFQPQSPKEQQKMTMRDILRQIAQLFDPNGYLGPTIVRAKIIMQRIWKSKVGWDAQVPEKIGNDWLEFQSQLPALARIRIPRWLGTAPQHSFELHGFADASESAYGAVFYIRVEQEDKTMRTLLASRSRVAPVKMVSVPRLELCAAVLLSELLEVVRKACSFENSRTVLWTDSSIVLNWMEKDPETLKPFVHNHIQKVKNLTANCEWRHVATADNPADSLSRGVAPEKLESLWMWWNGPEWLVKNESEWPMHRPEFSVLIEREVYAEMKSNWLEIANDKKLRPIQKALVNVAVFEIRGESTLKNAMSDLLTRTSSWRRLIRRTAWLWRYINNLKLRGENTCKREIGDVTEAEEEQAITSWVKREQFVNYGPELKALRSGEPIPVKSQLLGLNPFIDQKEVIRVGGRLEHSTLTFEQKHPIILPDLSHLAKLLIREAHEQTLHGGFKIMAAALRQRFWITNLRRAVRTFISRCYPCIRQGQRTCEQIMGNLPADRIQQSSPFAHSGVDYAGPFEVKARGGRCKIIEKKYVAVFVCMSTKAVHLELVENLSSSAFIAAFLRFTGIRGSCTHLWSDNGTSFVGAEKELAQMVNSWSQIDSEAYKQIRELRVKWHFITPSAPHQGGLWESKVKAMKYHLRRVVGKQKLSSSEFQTLLAQISAILNSRPLTAISDDPNDLDFLSPGHLICGRPLKQLFGERIEETHKNVLRRYAITQQLSQSFWKQWHQTYLNELQQRSKWKIARKDLKLGDLVLIKDENAAPTFWPTGRITKTFPGTDGHVRNVELKVAGKKRRVMRSVQKLVLLPFDIVEESADSSRGECTVASVTSVH